MGRKHKRDNREAAGHACIFATVPYHTVVDEVESEWRKRRGGEGRRVATRTAMRALLLLLLLLLLLPPPPQPRGVCALCCFVLPVC